MISPWIAIPIGLWVILPFPGNRDQVWDVLKRSPKGAELLEEIFGITRPGDDIHSSPWYITDGLPIKNGDFMVVSWDLMGLQIGFTLWLWLT